MKVSELDRLFSILNSYYFRKELPSKPIMIGKNNNLLDGIYIQGEDPIQEVLHEMVHLYCLINDIKDTSRQGRWHNKAFKEIAESHGLICVKDSVHGYKTKLNKETLDLIKNNNINISVPTKRKEKAKQSYIRLYCPSCGCSVRGTKETFVFCANPECPAPQLYIPTSNDGRKKTVKCQENEDLEKTV